MRLKPNIPMDEYRQWPEKSQSDIKKAWRSIRHYLTPFGEETQSMMIGSIFHQILLEPDLEPYWVVGPAVDKRTKVWKEFVKENEGKTIISADDETALQLMVESVLDHNQASQFVSAPGHVEVSTTGTVCGLDMKGRADKLSGGFLLDVKTTIDASPSGFQNSIYKFGYDIQAYVYTELFKTDTFIFLCVENKAPFNCAVYKASDEMLEAGEERFRICASRVKKYMKSGVIEGYQRNDSDVLEEIGLPHWAYKEVYA